MGILREREKKNNNNFLYYEDHETCLAFYPLTERLQRQCAEISVQTSVSLHYNVKEAINFAKPWFVSTSLQIFGVVTSSKV